MKRKILFILATIFFSLVEISFLSSLGGLWQDLDLILCLVIFIAFMAGYQQGLWFAIISGLMLDLYSPLFFSTITVSLLISVFLINLLFVNFFTNKSLYSLLVLGVAGVIIYNLLLLIFSNLFFSFGISEWKIFLDTGWLRSIFNKIIFDIIVLFLFFIITEIVNKKFRSVFVWKN